jgi:hypothetical protein
MQRNYYITFLLVLFALKGTAADIFSYSKIKRLIGLK